MIHQGLDLSEKTQQAVRCSVRHQKMMQDKSGYDPARAITDLQMAQVAIEASAQIINSLKSTSLLNLLR